jgi:hypothetical protein
MPPQPLTPPPAHPDEAPFVCIQINSTWIPYIIGLLWPAKFPEYWAGTLEQNRNARRDVQNLIYQFQGMEDCGEMNNCCIDLYIIQRVNVSHGGVEISIDNGTTWTPKPGTLITKIVEPVPPVITGVSADKCEAANNANQGCLEYIENVSTNFTEGVLIIDFGLAVAGNIIALALILLATPELIPVETAVLTDIGVAVTGAFEAGKAAWDSYWSIENKQRVFCAIVCTIGTNGSWGANEFEAFYAKLSHDLPGHVAKVLFMAMIGQLNKPGLNVMAAKKGTIELDCTDCDCEEHCDITLWSLLDGASGVIDTTTRTDTFVQIASSLRGDGRWYVIFIAPTSADCCNIGAQGDNSGQIYVPSGTPDASSYSPCGATPSSIVGSGLPLGFGSTEMNGILYSGTTPFTLAIDTARP